MDYLKYISWKYAMELQLFLPLITKTQASYFKSKSFNHGESLVVLHKSFPKFLTILLCKFWNSHRHITLLFGNTLLGKWSRPQVFPLSPSCYPPLVLPLFITTPCRLPVNEIEPATSQRSLSLKASQGCRWLGEFECHMWVWFSVARCSLDSSTRQGFCDYFVSARPIGDIPLRMCCP